MESPIRALRRFLTVLALTFGFATPLSAASLVDINGIAGSQITLTVAPGFNPRFPGPDVGQDILGVLAGSYIGTDVLTGVYPNPNQPFAAFFPGSVLYDNFYYQISATSPTHFDFGGTIFTTATNGLYYHLYGNGGAYKLQSLTLTQGRTVLGALQTVTPTFVEYDPVNGAVPEPATWALMILGFGAAGAMLRRRRFAFVN